MKKNYDSLTYFIYNYRKIRISLLGGYSTGKSSFLNCLIGKDILPCDLNRCTNRGIIIRHNENENSQLFKTKFIKVENPDYCYFQEEKEPICQGDEEIKKKLIELNNEKLDFENSFVVLKIPLKMFSELDIRYSHFKKTLMEKIELIDYPGLDMKDDLYQKEVFSSLMKFSDGFIFVNDCDLIEEKGNLDILEKIMNEIQYRQLSRKLSFSYKSSLFLLNKLDKSSLSLDIDKSKKLFKKFFFKNNEKNKDDLNVDKFSSKLYYHYIQFYNKYIKKFDLYLKYIIDNLVESQEKEELKNYIEFLNLINSKTKKLTNVINKKLAKINKDIKEDLNSINDCLHKAFCELTIKYNIKQEENDFKADLSLSIVKQIFLNYFYLYNNYKYHKQRVASNANNLFESLLKLFENSYSYTEEQFSKYFNLFIEDFNKIFITIDLKIFGNLFKGHFSFNEEEKKYLECGKRAKQIYDETIEYIKNEREKIIKKTKETLDSFYRRYCDDRDINNRDELEKLENSINYRIKNYFNQINDNISELNLVKQRLVMNDKNSILGCNTFVFLNKNSGRYDQFGCEDDNVIEKIIHGFGNIFIFVLNKFNEKEVLLKNLNNYLEEIENLLIRYKDIFEEKIKKKTDKIFDEINDNLIYITGNFDEIIKKREQYEKIKEQFYKIINIKK